MKTRNVSDLFGTKLYLEKIWAEKQRGGEGSSSLGLHFSTFFSLANLSSFSASFPAGDKAWCQVTCAFDHNTY